MSTQTYETNSKNSIASALKVFAWLIIVTGFILGTVMAKVEVPYVYISGTHTEWSFTLALSYWAASFVSGLVFLGFAEIIILLQEIVDNGGRTLVLPSSTVPKPEPEQFSDLPNL